MSSGHARWADWRDRAAAAAKTGTAVPVIGGTVEVGSRVKHMNQAFGYCGGTATVIGFEVGDGWTKVLVKSERRGDSCFLDSDASRWDFDRTERAADPFPPVPADSESSGEEAKR